MSRKGSGDSGMGQILSASCDVRVLETFGITPLASFLGVSADELAVTAAAVIGGVSAPEGLVKTLWGHLPRPSLDLVLPGERTATGRLLDCLVAELDRLQRILVGGSSRFDSRVFHVLTNGMMGKVPKEWKGLMEKTLEHHSRALDLPADCSSFLLREDIRKDPDRWREEALMHPRFLLMECPGADFGSRVSECHRRHALLVLRRLPEPGGRDRIEKVFERIIGIAADGGSGGGSRRGIGDPPSVCAVLALDAEGRLTATTGGLFRHFLWLAPGSPPEAVSGREAGASSFWNAYLKGVHDAVEGRRNGGLSWVYLESEAALHEFSLLSGQYEQDCDAVPEGCGAAARGVPAALLLLFLSLKAAFHEEVVAEVDEMLMVKAAFAISGRVLQGHRDGVGDLVRTVGIERDVQLAEAVMQRIEEGGKGGVPLTRRSLVRRFNGQRKDRFEPVLTSLVQLGVASGNAREGYQPGEVLFEDVEESFREIAGGRHGWSNGL